MGLGWERIPSAWKIAEYVVEPKDPSLGSRRRAYEMESGRDVVDYCSHRLPEWRLSNKASHCTVKKTGTDHAQLSWE